MRIARIGILIDEAAAERRKEFGINVFERFLGEILEHRGISFQWLSNVEGIPTAGLDVLIVGLAEESDRSSEHIQRFAERGGVVISYGGLNHLAGKFGFMTAARTGAGYAYLDDHFGERRPLRYLQAAPWMQRLNSTRENEMASGNPSVYTLKSDSSSAPFVDKGHLVDGRPDGAPIGAALQQFSAGAGFIDRWSVNIPYTVVGLMQGTRPVLEDGPPAPDGTGPVDDNVLKADDQAEVDWEWDRVKTPGGAPFFPHPYADLWREALLGHLLERVVEQGLTLPFTGYWPEGISHVALVSLDSDHTGDVEAATTFELLRELDIPSTWCMMEKEYSSEMYARIEAAGDELALHYNAVPVDHGSWGAEEFRRQAEWFRATTGNTAIISNKNHLTRVEGWGELFRWCEENGIASDQTRGSSKKGNVGFQFGTCHPYFPIAWFDECNRLYNVLEIGFHYGDFLSLDKGFIPAVLDQAKRVEGVIHFTFHPIHVHRREDIRDYLRSIVSEARERGFAFWTGAQINEWERARRKLRIAKLDERGVPVFSEGSKSGTETASERVGLPNSELHSELAGLTVYIPLPVSERMDWAAELEMRHGVLCRKVVLKGRD